MLGCTQNASRGYYCPGTAIRDTVDRLPLLTVDELLGVEMLYVVGVVAVLGRIVRDFRPRGLEELRKPLTFVIAIYNAFQIYLNLVALAFLVVRPSLVAFAWRTLDDVPEVVRNLDHQILLVMGTGWYYLKVLDLFDTLFFTLRGKFRHISVLQVYHHATMVLITWFSINHIAVSQNLFYAVINSGIHVALYLYYFLTNLGARPTWKRALTVAQMLQFVAMFAFTVYLAVYVHVDSRAHWYTAILGVQTVVFLGLFGNFYVRSYLRAGKAHAD